MECALHVEPHNYLQPRLLCKPSGPTKAITLASSLQSRKPIAQSLVEQVGMISCGHVAWHMHYLVTLFAPCCFFVCAKLFSEQQDSVASFHLAVSTFH